MHVLLNELHCESRMPTARKGRVATGRRRPLSFFAPAHASAARNTKPAFIVSRQQRYLAYNPSEPAFSALPHFFCRSILSCCAPLHSSSYTPG